MATIKQYQTKTGTKGWEFYVYAGRDAVTGKKNTIHRRGYESKKAAELAASKALLNMSNTWMKAPSARMTFRDVYEQWDIGYKNTVRESTYVTTGFFAAAVLKVLGNTRIDQITPTQLQLILNSWAADTVRAFSLRFGVIRRVMKFALKSGYITSNPADLVVMPKGKQRDDDDLPIKFYDRDELKQLFGAIDADSHPMQFTYFRLLAFSGMRRGEAEALTWADISQSEGTVSITKTRAISEHGYTINPPKTKAGIRTIALDPLTLKYLQQWHVKQLAWLLSKGINANHPNQLVFSNRDNQLLRQPTPEAWLRKYIKKAKMDHAITIHGFRHSHASALFAAGASIKEVQTRLGHSNAQTTLNVYTHVTKSQGEKAAEKVANYLNF